MTTTQSSRRAVFRCIVQTTYYEWPAYATTTLYDRSSTGGRKEDASTVAGVWFDHDAHESTEKFVCYWPLAYATLDDHDRYTGQTRYEMEQLVRVFLLKELHGWTHETSLTSYLEQRPALCRQVGFETLPDQSTLWRTWHRRFSADLQETIQECARTILIKAKKAGVDVPRSPRGNTPILTTKTLLATRRGSRKQTT